MNIQSDDYDSPWKEILEEYFQDFMDFFFPEIACEIDWDKGHTFLDKELQQVVRDAELGRRLADKLAQVWCRDGDEAWVLVHIEVQGQQEAAFAKRMYIYNYRIFDRYNRPVVSLAALADQKPGWKPQSFGYELWGCEVGIKFPVVKLLDYSKRWKELEESHNPFAIAVMAHLKTRGTRSDELERKRWKIYLIKHLYKCGYRKKDVINLFKFIDWIMSLPEDLDDLFWQEVRQYEEEKNMPYVTSVERIGIKKGIQQGIQQGRRDGLIEAIEMGLSIKFGAIGLKLFPEIRAMVDLNRLEMVKEAIKAAHDVSELEELLK